MPLFTRRLFSFAAFVLLLLLSGCEVNQVIVNNVPERDANEIIVFLSNRGIPAEKIPAPSAGAGAETTANLWNIAVETGQMTQAMTLLSQNGLPRYQGTSLLELFAKQGLMSSEKEETIRYQAGLAQQVANMIRMIDGVIDAQVQISFPPEETFTVAEKQPKKITASVYVKHQGILDDPNSHLITKIKRLVSGSVTGLDMNDVTLVSDRARFADLGSVVTVQNLSPEGKEYVSIWSVILNKQSVARFQLLFFTLSFFLLVFLSSTGWLIWKFYPILKRAGGIRQLFHPIPLEIVPSKETNENNEKAEKAPPAPQP